MDPKEVADEDFVSKLNRGYYGGVRSYPKRVPEPKIFNQRIADLSDSDLDRLPSIVADYRAEVAKYQADVAAYHAEERRLEAEFRKDIAVHYGMVGHPKEVKIFNKAWEDGHSAGLQDVNIIYAELVDLVK